MSRTVFVDVDNIDWDVDDYLEEDIEFDDLDLPRDVDNLEVELYDYDPDTPIDELDEGEVEEAILEMLTDEYGFCINILHWEFVKYNIVNEDGKYVVRDEQENKVIDTFDTVDEANKFVETMKDLMNKN